MSSKLSGQWAFLKSQPGFRKAPVSVILRLASWRWICCFRTAKTVRLKARGLTLYLPAQWHGAGKLIYVFRDDYETDLALLNIFLGPGQVMVDVGANYGVFSLVASRIVGPHGKVFAFEPARATFSVFERNLALNAITNVKPSRLALSEQPGKLQLYHNPDATRNSLAPSADSGDFEEVEVRTLDDVLKENTVSSVGFLKIDVEGADEFVCRGGVQTLEASLPPVLFENNIESASRLGLNNSTGQTLGRLGYQFYEFDGSRFSALKSNALPGGNIVAVHPASRAASLLRKPQS